MNLINYHHLLYFRTVVKEGSIAKACQVLHVSQPAISTQLKTLEKILCEKLFQREGRGLIPTEVGRVVYRYADEIFNLGQEMFEALKGRPTGQSLRLRIGVADVLPKTIAFKLICPALHLGETVQIACYEDRVDRLLASLVLHELDIVFSDAPIPASMGIRAFSHFLGECHVSIVGNPKLARQYRKKFPHSLDRAPFLLPLLGTALRSSMDRWFEASGIAPVICGEFEDSALLKAFGNEGVGLFAVPQVILDQVVRDYHVQPVGDILEIKESFYALSMERKLKHPAVGAIVDAAKNNFFK